VTLLGNSFLAAGLVAALGAPALAYEARSVEGGGSIEGVVRFNGAVETRTVVPTKDMAICGAPREEPVIRVGADKAVESAVVYLVGVTAGKPWPAAAGAPKLNQQNCRFEPEVQVIPAGPLDVMNSDPVLHNTQGFYGRRSAFNIALPNQGQVIPVELQRPGTVRIDCDAHGWMEGWIYVVDNPYFASTGADGAFSIADVPPGEYTLVAVQPSTGPIETKVTVTGGQATRLDIELIKK
jgi:Carboxypeptidase regulatory-like domain